MVTITIQHDENRDVRLMADRVEDKLAIVIIEETKKPVYRRKYCLAQLSGEQIEELRRVV